MKLELKQQHYLLILVIALIAAGGGFFVGKASTSVAGVPSQGNFRQYGGNGGQMMGANGSGTTARTRNGSQMINGEITAVDTDSITIKTSDGSSKIVLLSNSAAVVQTSTASKNDLKTGTKVAVFGTSNTDGSVTAKSVQINPQTVGFGGPGTNGAAPSGTPQQP